MTAPPFLSMFNSQKRLGSSKRVVETDREDDSARNTPGSDIQPAPNAVDQYKHIMDEIKREHPHLSIGAQQHMALERCVKVNEEQGREQGQVDRPSGLLGIMSKLRVRNKSQRDGKLHVPAVEEEHRLTSIGSSTQESTSAPDDDKRLSLGFKKSVMSMYFDDGDAFNLTGDENDESLQDSLEDIEKTCNLRASRRGIIDCKVSSRRLSGLSLDLSDVEEDEVSNTLAEQNKVGASPRNEKSLKKSVTANLTDEIKEFFEDFGTINHDSNPHVTRRAASFQVSAGSQKSENVDTNRRSLMSSLRSVDSLNFKGDFSAWGSFREKS